MFITCVIDGFYAYFICVCQFYYNRLLPVETPKEEEKMEEAMAEKKDDAMMEEPAEMAME